MCITGCSPKLRFFDDIFFKLKENKITLNDIKKDESFIIHDINIPIEKYISLNDEDKDKLIKELISDENFFYNEYVFIGTLIFSEGKVKDIDLWEKVLNNINFSVYHGRSDVTYEFVDFDNEKVTFPYSLRPVTLGLFKKGHMKYPDYITINFFYSHNSKIKGYMYS